MREVRLRAWMGGPLASRYVASASAEFFRPPGATDLLPHWCMEAASTMVGFAGSARLGERRRRRLASETEPPKPSRKRRTRIDTAHSEDATFEPELSVPLTGETPLHALLPRRRWTLVATTIASFWLLVAAVYLSLVGEFNAQLQPLVGIDSGQLLRTLGTLLLAGSIQWCWVIYWYRKRGRRDFQGDYRRWLLAAATFAIALPCWTADVHRAFGRYASPRLPQAEWNTPDLCWMIPFGTAAVLYGFGLLREMLPMRLRGLLLAAGLGWLLLAATALLAGPTVLQPVGCQRLSLIATTMAFWCFFHCLWLQARHVVRVTNEPPRPERLRPLALREAMETGLLVARNSQRIATSPYRVVRESVSHWQSSRAEAAAERLAEKEARREQKEAARAAAIADREAMKQAKLEAKQAALEAKQAAAEEKAAAKQAAAEERAAAKAAAADEKRAAADAKREAAEATAQEEAAAPAEQPALPEIDPPSEQHQAEREAGQSRRQRKASRRNQPAMRPEPTLDADQFASESADAVESGNMEEDDEDLSHLSRKERRRLRKQRRG